MERDARKLAPPHAHGYEVLGDANDFTKRKNKVFS